jgi:hypothetical protein
MESAFGGVSTDNDEEGRRHPPTNRQKERLPLGPGEVDFID